MLIEFSVGNFASFKETITFSLVAARSIKSRIRELDKDNLIPVDSNLNLLTSAAIYGPNASGKSNLVKAAEFMNGFVQTSFRETQAGQSIGVQPFRLSTETQDMPSTFEIVFLIEGKQFRYGFAVTSEKVEREWLYMVPKNREIPLFERQGQEVRPNPSSIHAREFRAILTLLGRVNPKEPLRSNSLFLSVAAQNNGALARQLLNWFSNQRFISGLNDASFGMFTLQLFQNPQQRVKIIEMVKRLDVGIEDIEMVPESREDMLKRTPEPIRDLIDRMVPGKSVRFLTSHIVYDEKGQPVNQTVFELGQQESEGTQKLFFMAGLIIDALANGRVLWVDEMEARLHPNLTGALVELFNSRVTNPKSAQLIFTTHDTNLLDLRKLRRDQIWFIDKDNKASSRLYSLAEFRIRNDDASLELDYIRGIYGATPHLNDLAAVLEGIEYELK